MEEVEGETVGQPSRETDLEGVVEGETDRQTDSQGKKRMYLGR